jgi:hypothetical protein
MTHQVGLVVYEGSVQAWGIDLPGLVAWGRDRDELGAHLELALSSYLAWLRLHGEDAGDDIKWEAIETIDGSTLAATGGEFCFAAERARLSRDELERGITRMAFARDGVMAEVDGLPDAVLDWEPPASAMALLDAWAPEARTIRGIVEHVLQLETYYRAGLADGDAAGIFERVGAPHEERERTVALLRSLDDGARSRSYFPVRPGRSTPEEWTVRKVLRRIISHERHHAAEIAQRRAWLLVGVPRLDPSSRQA